LLVLLLILILFNFQRGSFQSARKCKVSIGCYCTFLGR